MQLGILVIVVLICAGLGAAAVRFGVLPDPFSSPLPPSSDSETAEAREAKAELDRSFPGRLLFDSNRSGTFAIYTMDIGDAEPTVLVDTPEHDMYPDPSPDGSLIVFARAESTARTAKSSIWLVQADGSNIRKLADNGTFPTFSKDGQTVYFERDRKRVMSVPTSGGTPQEIFPAQFAAFGNYDVIKPRVSPDGTSVAFISDRNGRWNAWIASLEDGTLEHIDEGCEPAWFSTGKHLGWIRTKNTKERSGLYKFERGTRAVEELQDAPPPRGHEYFPSIVASDRFLLFASCREGEHSHIDANYQIFVKDLQSNTVTRITFDPFTNRWPKLLVSPATRQ
ncbi:MAG: PD40 domain-containing protein [Bdellovibrionales bacterium]|nr:PD40 domain-containing protein [Bdellovibrionales bacterium]